MKFNWTVIDWRMALDDEYRNSVLSGAIALLLLVGLIAMYIPDPGRTRLATGVIEVQKTQLIAVGGDLIRHGAWIAITDQGEFFFNPKRARLREGTQAVKFLYQENIFGMGA